jgi:Protein of unknown function (DUF2934)
MSATAIVKLDSTDQEMTHTEPDDGRFDAGAPSDGSASNISELDVARLAYSLWEKRGCPDGCPEMDWFQAEQELRAR